MQRIHLRGDPYAAHQGAAWEEMAAEQSIIPPFIPLRRTRVLQILGCSVLSSLADFSALAVLALEVVSGEVVHHDWGCDSPGRASAGHPRSRGFSLAKTSRQVIGGPKARRGRITFATDHHATSSSPLPVPWHAIRPGGRPHSCLTVYSLAHLPAQRMPDHGLPSSHSARDDQGRPVHQIAHPRTLADCFPAALRSRTHRQPPKGQEEYDAEY
jgi:hypothetical protein